MVKLVNDNKRTPKKKELMDWGFTTVEGGLIQGFKFPKSKSAYERMVDEVTNPNNWSKYEGPHPEGRGSRSYTTITIIPGFDFLRVHALFFPDGKVWDSKLRDFRNVRDYEQNSR